MKYVKKTFSNKSSLTRHCKEKHSNDGNIRSHAICSTCGKTIRIDYMKIHEQICQLNKETNISLAKCNTCQQVFSNQSILRKKQKKSSEHHK